MRGNSGMRDGGGMMGNGLKRFILTVLVSLTNSFFLTQSLPPVCCGSCLWPSSGKGVGGGRGEVLVNLKEGDCGSNSYD